MKNLLLTLLLLPALAAAKVPVEEDIVAKTSDPDSPFYYTSLMMRYNAGDETLTDEDYHYLYYGYAYRDEYKPLAVNPDLDKMLTTLRKQHAAWVDADEAAANELRVNMDFVGSVDGEEFDGGKAEGFALVLGAGRMIPGFEDGIIGKKAGESFDIEVTFPEDYQAEHLKGKAAKFAIKLNKVEKQELPELDAEFIKRFGVEDGSIDSLKAEIRKNMERELNQALKNRFISLK
jgi:trigger factor